MSAFDVVARIPGLLAQGDATATGTPARGFDVLVLCAEEFQPDRGMFPSDMRVIRAPIDDSILTFREAYTAESAASRVARELRAGRRVLVTCMAGLNRSGLVSALALSRVYVWSGPRAASQVRAHRAGALGNASFMRYLSSMPGHQTARPRVSRHPGGRHADRS